MLAATALAVSAPLAGVYAAYNVQPADSRETILFDTNLDGTFGDTVNMAAGANAFTPGF